MRSHPSTTNPPAPIPASMCGWYLLLQPVYKGIQLPYDTHSFILKKPWLKMIHMCHSMNYHLFFHLWWWNGTGSRRDHASLGWYIDYEYPSTNKFLLPSSDSGYNLQFLVYGDLHLGHPHATDPLNRKRLIDVMLCMKECLAIVLIKRCCNP